MAPIMKEFFDSYVEAVIIYDSSFKPVYCNPAFERLTGFAATDLPTLNAGQFIAASSNAAGTSFVKKDGNTIWVKLSKSPLQLEDNQQAKIFTLVSIPTSGTNALTLNPQRVSDFTEVQQANNLEIEKLRAELKQAQEEADQFFYVASHDLQEPLRNILAYTQLMDKSIKTGNHTAAQEFMVFINVAGNRMHALINDLLQYSRVNKKGSPFTDVNLNQVLDIVRSNLAEELEQNEAIITSEYLPSVTGDTFQLVRLLQNLIENAVKFKHPNRKPQINISVQNKVEFYQFAVTDNGIGIDNKYYNRIFVIFQRLHGRNEYEGTGVGLAISKKIVERHGGHMWVESEIGIGTTFYFTLKK